MSDALEAVLRMYEYAKSNGIVPQEFCMDYDIVCAALTAPRIEVDVERELKPDTVNAYFNGRFFARNIGKTHTSEVIGWTIDHITSCFDLIQKDVTKTKTAVLTETEKNILNSAHRKSVEIQKQEAVPLSKEDSECPCTDCKPTEVYGERERYWGPCMKGFAVSKPEPVERVEGLAEALERSEIWRPMAKKVQEDYDLYIKAARLWLRKQGE